MGTVTYLHEWKFRKQSERDNEAEQRRFEYYMSFYSDDDLQTEYEDIHRDFEVITSEDE